MPRGGNESWGSPTFPISCHPRSGGPAVRPCRFAAVNQGWVRADPSLASPDDQFGGGDTATASAAKGIVLTEIIVERLAGLLHELAASPLDETFPY